MSVGKRNVVLTGFGPFGVHSTNNSWECVKLVKSSDFESKNNVNLIIKEIPVIYEVAEKVVPELWAEYDPILVVHVGVHNADSVLVEKRAHADGYVRSDIINSSPKNGKCPEGTEIVVHTGLDLDCIKSNDIQCSSDAGRYLCEYTYYLSLSRDNSRTLFVHVPPCHSCVASQSIVTLLCNILEKCLAQLREQEE